MTNERFKGESGFIRPSRPDVFTAWTLRFRQFSFHLAIRASSGVQFGGFAAPCLSEHAVFPYAFRYQVGSVAQEYCTQFLLCCTGIKLRRDTTHLSEHAFQAFVAVVFGAFLAFALPVIQQAGGIKFLAAHSQSHQHGQGAIYRLAEQQHRTDADADDAGGGQDDLVDYFCGFPGNGTD